MVEEFIQLRLTKEIRSLIKRWENIGTPQVLYKKLVVFFNRFGKIGASLISRNLLSGQLLRRRTGNLARSMTGRGEMLEGLPVMRIGIFRGPTLEYAAIQEYGTVGAGGLLPTIVPKKAKALAIPIKGGGATAVGVAKFSGPRSADVDLTFIPIGKSNPNVIGGLYETSTLTTKKGKKRKLSLKAVKLWYLLVLSVDIKPKHYLRKGMKKLMPELRKNLAEFLAELLTKEGKAVR